jgi:hypothetical protein
MMGAALGAKLEAFAVLFAVRAWLALLVSYAIAPSVKVKRRGEIDTLRWAEIAASSHAQARRQAGYRFSKIVLTAFLGPVGSIAARTRRGLRLDQRAEWFVPTHPGALVLLALTSATASAALIFATPKPPFLVVAAMLLRIFAAATNMLIWGQLSTGFVLRARPENHEDADDPHA